MEAQIPNIRNPINLKFEFWMVQFLNVVSTIPKIKNLKSECHLKSELGNHLNTDQVILIQNEEGKISSPAGI